MKFLKTILWYYHSEARHGFIGAAVGVLLLTSAFLLLKFANPMTWVRGLTVPFLIGGLIFGIGGALDGYITQNDMPEKARLYQQDERAFFREEVIKVERTHKSWFGIRLFWSLVTITGIALLFTVRKNFWIGVGLGTVLLGLIGHIEEAISMKRNEKYWREVLESAKKVSPPVCAPLKSGSVLPLPDKVDLIRKEEIEYPAARMKRDTASRLETTGYPQNTDLKAANFIGVSIAHRFSSSDANLEYDFSAMQEALEQAHSDANSTYPAQIASRDGLPGKAEKRKLLDYYRSDLIDKNGVSAKRGWFNRKYIK